LTLTINELLIINQLLIMINDLNPYSVASNLTEPFFELSPDLLCIAGFDGYFKRLNPAVSKTLGYSMAELYSRPINDFVFHDDKNVTSEVREQLKQNKPLFNFENRYVTKSGEIVWLSWTSLPLSSNKLVFAIAKNVTHKKKLEEDRNQLFANLTKINGNLNQLIYSASHDLRAPVKNLLVLFDMLDTSKIGDAETLKFIDILKLTTETLNETLDSYLNLLTKKDEQHVMAEEVNLAESLNIVLQSISSLIQNSKAAFEVDFSQLETIRFNKVQLESIFLNLVTNAIKYARPGCFPVISVRSKKIDGFNQLAIADNGLGFDMEKVKDKIFGLHEKFHNHSDSRGIGLYLVYNYITNAGGQIAVESKINEGTKFTISFKK